MVEIASGYVTDVIDTVGEGFNYLKSFFQPNLAFLNWQFRFAYTLNIIQ